jgi:hypothetical protein
VQLARIDTVARFKNQGRQEYEQHNFGSEPKICQYSQSGPGFGYATYYDANDDKQYGVR